MDDSIIKRMVQLGTVTSVDSGKLKARVLFRESNMTSGWLSVVQRTGESTSCSEAGDPTHKHTVSVGSWMPKVNDVVLCIYPPVPNSDGYIVGRCP